MHKLACVSGIAAAHRLGADYYIRVNNFASDFFSKFLLLSHGVRFSREEKRRDKVKLHRKVNKFNQVYVCCQVAIYL